jgi:hypothetical protein
VFILQVVVVDLQNLLLTLFSGVVVVVVMDKSVIAQPPVMGLLIPAGEAGVVQTVLVAPVVKVL